MHEVEALIAKGDELVAQVRQFKNAVVCPLVQGFSLLPITDVFASELAGYQTGASAVPAKPIESMSDGLHALAITISHSTSVAYISTYYFGGLPGEGQDALVWDKARLTFSPATQGYDRIWPNTPISQALRMIGVVAENEMDEFDTVDLGKHRKNAPMGRVGEVNYLRCCGA